MQTRIVHVFRKISTVSYSEQIKINLIITNIQTRKPVLNFIACLVLILCRAESEVNMDSAKNFVFILRVKPVKFTPLTGVKNFASG